MYALTAVSLCAFSLFTAAAAVAAPGQADCAAPGKAAVACELASAAAGGGGLIAERADRTYVYEEDPARGCYFVRPRPLSAGVPRRSAEEVRASAPAGARRCALLGRPTRWREVLRVEDPEIALDPPGGLALTGKRVYAVVGGAAPMALRTPDVVLSATPVMHRIDWGDGAVTTTAERGAGYPGGPPQNTHLYQRAGTYTISVTTFWDAVATPAGRPAQRFRLQTEGRVGLRAVERQAVRHR